MESNQLRQLVESIQRTLLGADNRDNPERRKAAFVRSAVIALAAADRERTGYCGPHTYVHEAETLWDQLPEKYR
jgi:hypothetical protein